MAGNVNVEKLAIVGHSFVRRFEEYIQAEVKDKDFDCVMVETEVFGQGGLDKSMFETLWTSSAQT